MKSVYSILLIVHLSLRGNLYSQLGVAEISLLLTSIAQYQPYCNHRIITEQFNNLPDAKDINRHRWRLVCHDRIIIFNSHYRETYLCQSPYPSSEPGEYRCTIHITNGRAPVFAKTFSLKVIGSEEHDHLALVENQNYSKF